MVEHIEELGPELDPHPLADVRSFENSQIPVVDSGTAEYGINPRFCTSAPVRWRGEARSVKPLA